MNERVAISVQRSPETELLTAHIITGLTEFEADVLADLDQHSGRYLRNADDDLRAGWTLTGQVSTKDEALRRLEEAEPGFADRFAAEVARREPRLPLGPCNDPAVDSTEGHGWAS